MYSNFFIPFKIPVKVLKFFGLWTTNASSVAYKVYGTFMSFIFIHLHAFLMVMYLPLVTDVKDFSQLMSIMPIYLALSAKSLNLMLRADKLEEIFQSLRQCIEEFGISKTFNQNLKVARYFYTGFWMICFCSCVMSVFSIIFWHELYAKMWFPYEINTPFRFWTAALYQIIDATCYSCEFFDI